jgi:hypothetical protein
MKYLPTIETITPEQAGRLLESNQHNRSLRQAWVDSLAAMMTRGEWVLDGATIKISEDGTLLDGQHRLAAIVASGVSLDMVVVRGLSIGAQDTVDVGRGRRLADVLAIEGHTDAHALGAAISFLHRYRTGQRMDTSRATAPTPQQALALIEETPELRESVRVARRLTKEIGGPIGVFAGLHHVFGKVDQGAADDFFAHLTSGLDLQRGDPVWHLRRHILRPRSDRTYAHTSYYVAGITIKAFNYRRAGRTIELLLFKSTEQFPAVEHGSKELSFA